MGVEDYKQWATLAGIGCQLVSVGYLVIMAYLTKRNLAKHIGDPTFNSVSAAVKAPNVELYSQFTYQMWAFGGVFIGSLLQGFGALKDDHALAAIDFLSFLRLW